MAKQRTRKPAGPASPGRQSRDEKAYIDSLIANGQAARPLADGTLPPGATHELIEDENGVMRAIRRRFSSL
jgi:hypothetical protein